MTKEVISAVNILHAFFNGFNNKSTDEEVNEGVLVSNYLDLLMSDFVNDVVRVRLEKRAIQNNNIIFDNGAKA